MILYHVLQHYYDNLRSPESWNSLLTSLLAENNWDAWALRQSDGKTQFYIIIIIIIIINIFIMILGQAIHQMFSGFPSSTDTKTQSYTTAWNTETAIWFFPEAAERAISRSYAIV